jgi:hypothetical protein
MTPCPRFLTLLPPATGLALLLSTGMAAAESQAPQSTAEAVASAKWADTVTITPGGTSFRYVSDGLTNHALAEAYLVPIGQEQPFTEFEVKLTEGFVTATPIDVTIPLVPVYSDTPADTSLGMIGVMISGARLFNDYENPERSIVAMDDQHIQDGVAFLDSCNAHPLQNGSSYHYHASPPCVTETVDGTGAHSAMIGMLLDGFPIYGPQGEGGTIVQNADLDQCSGHVGPTPEFPKGIYHYHLTTEEAPYSIDCYHGVVDASLTQAMGGPGGPPPDFAAIAAKLGVDQHALMDALSTQRPPDFATAAKTLGISETALRDAMGPPPAP